jgi:serine/threonine protein kinase/tetratricopeptide (TPR) repeat protein
LPSELVERLADDMVRRWQQGQRPRVEDYLGRHPELAGWPGAALELIAEEISLRHEHGEDPVLADFPGRFPQWGAQVRALLSCHTVMAGGPAACFPSVGESLGEFDLLAEIGRGGHARVFLARQPDLADRLVVLKLGPRVGREHLSLARLQHSNIVPLYSAHDFPASGLRGLCLPYFGGATLDHLAAAMAAVPPGARTGNDLVAALAGLQEAAPGGVAVGGPACRFLERAGYVEAVCWLGACLADALHYAHERGLVHLDLKPANVLLAADGQPMLLDFHLASRPLARGAGPARLGGTPGYMAPEQESAVQAVAAAAPLPGAVDGRADIYSLGRLLCELLAGRLPPVGEEARWVRRHNPHATAGLADLLGRCVAADPGDRYLAGELAADLRRHLADMPLRGVPNRSVAERWRKWRRRRPFALPVLVLGLLVAAPCVLVAGHLRRQGAHGEAVLREGQERLDSRHYAGALESFRHASALAGDLPWRPELGRAARRGRELAERAAAADQLHALCERLRPLYGVDGLPAGQARAAAGHCRALWGQRELIHRLLAGQADRALESQVRADLLDLAIVWAHLRVRLGDDPAARREALQTLDQAEALLGGSCVLRLERRALGKADAGPSNETPPRTAWEHYVVGRAHLAAGDCAAALAEMDRAQALEPRAVWPTFHKGCCAYRLGRFDDAVTAFSICLVLEPGSAWCAYNRALAYAELGRTESALADHDRALRLDPHFAAAALGRGMLHHRAGRHAQALADLGRARREGLDSAALHGGLALVHLALEDREAARDCATRALRRDPACPQALGVLRRLGERR